MIKFILSDSYTTLKFTAKSSNVLLPKSFKDLDEKSQDLLKHFIEIARDLYISKVNNSSTNQLHNINKLRQTCIKEAERIMCEEVTEEVFNPVYESFKAMGNTTTTIKLRKPKSSEFTKLDLIENEMGSL
jgi:hypothetical protein